MFRSSAAIRGAADRPAESERRSHPSASRSSRAPVQPHVLRPVSIGFLGGLEIMQHAEGVVFSARRQQSAGTLDQIARPDQVVTAEIFVALVEAPGNGKAGDDSAEEVLGFVRAQNRHAGPIQVFFPRLLVELLESALPILPVEDVIVAGGFVRREQGRDDLLAGLRPDSAEAEGENELAVAGGQVNFAQSARCFRFPRGRTPTSSGNVATGLASRPTRRQIRRNVLARARSSRGQARANRAGRKASACPCNRPPSRYCHIQNCPGATPAAHRGGSREISLSGTKPNFLQHHVSPGIGQHFFFDPVPALHASIGQFEDRHSGFDRKVLEGTMALFFGEEPAAVGDNQAEVAGAGLIHAGKINLVENAVTQREPNAAVEVQRGADSGLGARSPARFDSGPARRITKMIIAHRGSSSPSSSLPEVANCLEERGKCRSQKPGCRARFNPRK
jgi:hypothetical protein